MDLEQLERIKAALEFAWLAYEEACVVQHVIKSCNWNKETTARVTTFNFYSVVYEAEQGKPAAS